MPELIEVEDAADPRLADYVRLRDVELRKSLEAERGLFIAEGEKVIRRAVTTGYPVRSVLTTRRWLPGLADVLGGARVYLVPEDVMAGIAGFAVHRGALASMARRELPDLKTLLTEPPGTARGTAGFDAAGAGPRRVLVLEDLVDHGNVGAIFRCAAALGVEAVVLSPRCADPLYRRSVKVSMGAVFAVPYARMYDWHHGLAELRDLGFRTLALTPAPAATPIDEVALGPRVALLLGSEGDGLSSRWLREADEAVRIPMSPQAMSLGVDSLNVVAAAAIACHGLMRGAPAGR
ncbi:rRNA methyltransferase [Sphaerisporangium siamense]|uniref:tRNA G18 (Ribose-2'-O)-methylase SpoU n=1 Tax=Sphaerisporangium siamense TaxID=795645 RepID=A0A7W7D803_9ACTN|nr:RNA methyltransferase [Sphaerisporangium siamense]MBB4701719.1 tRNA G18 (ribose-2'-O)-methylase SpoU [Sphaerisporangium siamense]GII84377.1 rRNA methyltransferase [Sphaerisporangium siamense]